MSEHQEPHDEERLLELLLGGDEVALERASRDPQLALRLESERLFLDRCRAALQVEQAPQAEGRLVQDLLARTTRLDPSVRGDMHLVGRFLRERFAASPALRVAAAIVLVQVFALPVLAWMVWRAPEPQPRLHMAIEPRLEPFLPAVPEEPIEELVLAPEPEVMLLEAGSGRQRVPTPPEFSSARAARSGANALRAAALPSLDVEPGVLSRLLDERQRALSAPILEQGPAPLSSAPSAPLARALWTELALDRMALAGEAPAGLSEALAAAGSQAAPRAVLRLEALALERARSYGLVDQGAWERLGDLAPPGSRPPAAPLDGTWRGALADALRSDPEGRALLRDAQLDGWLAPDRTGD